MPVEGATQAPLIVRLRRSRKRIYAAGLTLRDSPLIASFRPSKVSSYIGNMWVMASTVGGASTASGWG